MKLEAKIFKGAKIVMEDEAIFNGQGKFQQQLERCLITLCKNMSISVPIWVGKNTREFVRFKWTSFNEDQFFDKVFFDRFEIRLIE